MKKKLERPEKEEQRPSKVAVSRYLFTKIVDSDFLNSNINWDRIPLTRVGRYKLIWEYLTKKYPIHDYLVDIGMKTSTPGDQQLYVIVPVGVLECIKDYYINNVTYGLTLEDFLDRIFKDV